MNYHRRHFYPPKPRGENRLRRDQVTAAERVGLRWRLMWCQQRRCAECDEWLEISVGMSPNDPEFPTLDHVTPHAAGGSYEMGNLLVKHRRCNLERGDQPPTDLDWAWVKVIGFRAAWMPADLDDVIAAVLAMSEAA